VGECFQEPTQHTFYHARMWRGNIYNRLSVCLSVLFGFEVNVEYQGHGVKVKVQGHTSVTKYIHAGWSAFD